MVRYGKKNQFDAMEGLNTSRLQRKPRGHKLVAAGANKQERRYGWGYAKRRTGMIGDD